MPRSPAEHIEINQASRRPPRQSVVIQRTAEVAILLPSTLHHHYQSWQKDQDEHG